MCHYSTKLAVGLYVGCPGMLERLHFSQLLAYISKCIMLRYMKEHVRKTDFRFFSTVGQIHLVAMYVYL